MPIPYKVVKITQPGINGGGVLRYKARAAGRKKYDFDKFSKDLAKMSTVSLIDSAAMLSALNSIIPEKLLEGHIVDLGDFGSFRLEIQSEVKDTPEEVNHHTIKKATVHFRAGSRFRKIIENPTYEKIPVPAKIRRLTVK